MEDDSFHRLYEVYYQYKRKYLILKNDHTKKNEKKILLKNLELIKTLIDEKNIDLSEKLEINKNYHSYPDYNDPDFLYEITRKAEFYHCKIPFDILELSNKCNIDAFTLGNHQIFLKNFINRNTPYKSLLIFHGVGVGKTCSAITISNSFVDHYKSSKDTKKIICLVSKNIQTNWKNTIHNPNISENQCTGTTYHDIINNIDSKKSKEKLRNKVVKDYYEFYGYQEFSNKIKNMIKIYLKNKDPKDYTPDELALLERKAIKNYFSDRLFIIDEVHNLRDENITKLNKDESRDVLKYLDKVIKYSENLRLIIMSATPMFNKASEIQWILNMLLKNDNRPILKKNELFNKKNKLNVEKLIKKSKGYISYLRGENPITFPIRLYPEDVNCLSKENKNYPMNDLWGNKYPDDFYYFKNLKLYFNQMIKNEYQSEIYNNYLNQLPKSNVLSLNDQKRGVQISNIVYPPIDVLSGEKKISDYDPSSMYSGSAFMKIMKPGRKSYSYSNRYKSKVEGDYGPLFSLQNIGKVSSKISNLLNGLKSSQSEGIIFIYTEYITSGVIPLALALEHMGFQKYSGNILNYPEWNSNYKHTKDEPINHKWKKQSNVSDDFKQAKYIILSGQKDLSPNNDEEIKALTNKNNYDGSNIKIVIGSAVTSEGLDFKNIREIHILDPWFHLYKIEQIIGRGIRFCSHMQLKPINRNVSVYLHVSGNEPKNESIDTYIYRIAEKKASEIGKVEMVLKSNAIDCYLNKPVNYIDEKNVAKIKVRSSRKIVHQKHSIHDKEYSKICSFSKKCNFNCNMHEKIKEKDIKYDTLSIETSKELLVPIQKIIFELFEIKNYYLLNEMVEKVLLSLDTNNKLIYFAIYDLVKQKKTIWNHNNISGYIICRNKYYLFQPYSNTDEMIPLYYRNIEAIQGTKQFIKLNDNLFTKKVDPPTEVNSFIYSTIIEKLKSKIKIKSGLIVEHFFGDKMKKKRYSIQKLFKENNPLNKEKVFFEFYLDALHSLEKVVLLEKIVREKIETNKIQDPLENHIFNYFKNQLITIDSNDNYHLFRNDLKLCGFYVFNHTHFYNKKNKKKELDDIQNDYDFYIYRDNEFYEVNDKDHLEDGLLIKKK